MKTYLVLALAVLTSACGAFNGGLPGTDPQEWGRIAIIVTEATTHQPIAGAMVTVDNAWHSSTDAQGEAAVQVYWYVRNTKHDALGDFQQWNVWVDKAGYVSVQNEGGLDGSPNFVIVRPAQTTHLAVSMKVFP